MSSLTHQVGGNHYKGFKYQPVELATKLRFNFIQGSILKYVTRYKKKGGKQDLEKAGHFSQLGHELNPINMALNTSTEIEKYVKQNGLPKETVQLISDIADQFWIGVSTRILTLVEKEYAHTQ